MLEVIDLGFEYQDKPLWNQVSFKVPESGLLHLKGANGAGKTTLLKVLSGLYQPSEGAVYFDNQDVSSERDVCYIGHLSGLNPYLTARENCMFDMHYQSLEGLSSIFNLESVWDYPCSLLSAGQKRQVSLLRLWMTKARLWLLDEPLVALDEKSLQILIAKINEHRRQGGIVILTSHQNLPAEIAHHQEYLL